ncbi:MAG: S8 family serine peptidase [Chloroflexi bacterium]|nr:S8 family serine peptidase [Chloroflexota bacterium]
MAELIAKAQANGSVRVIIGLRAGYQPEGRLGNSQAIQTQRGAIKQAQAALLKQISNHQVEPIKQFASIPYLVIEVDADALATLAFSPNVASVAPDRLRRPSLVESVPLIGASNAWANGYAGAGQVVAILDTGVDKMHPFLAGKVVSEACYSTTNSSDTAFSLCPGGVSQSTAPDSGLDCTSVGICIHGTHVAGIAAGKDNDAIGFSGVAKDANIISIQVFSFVANCGCIQAYDSDILSAMERVQTLSSSYNIAAINLSLGGEAYTTQAECDAQYPAYKDMIGNLRSLGIATVIASENDYSSNSIEAPGCVSGAISVGSTQDGGSGTTADMVSGFSDSASFLTLLAPGQYIYSSVPGTGFQTMMGFDGDASRRWGLGSFQVRPTFGDGRSNPYGFLLHWQARYRFAEWDYQTSHRTRCGNSVPHQSQAIFFPLYLQITLVDMRKARFQIGSLAFLMYYPSTCRATSGLFVMIEFTPSAASRFISFGSSTVHTLRG